MLAPNPTPRSRNRIRLAFEVAASATSPKDRLTQKALAEPFSDCRMLVPRTGSEKVKRVQPIDPVVAARQRYPADLYPRLGRTMEWDTAAADAIVERLLKT